MGLWVETKDGNPIARAIFGRHYTYRPSRDQMSLFWERNRNYGLFVGPGEKLVLLTPDASALFVWRKFRSDDGQQGVNCAVFRREGGEARASDLIREADAIACKRWPGERHYTYVNDRVVKSGNPGYCFLKAGWRRCGRTKSKRLVILEILYENQTTAASNPAPTAHGTQSVEVETGVPATTPPDAPESPGNAAKIDAT
jgi:hypothetical protein